MNIVTELKDDVLAQLNYECGRAAANVILRAPNLRFADFVTAELFHLVDDPKPG